MTGPSRGGGRQVDGDPVLQVVELRTELAAGKRERDGLAERLKSGELKVAELQQLQSGQAEELGRLRGLTATLDTVTSERDAQRERVVELQEGLPLRIQQQVAERLEEVGRAHTVELAALRLERDRLSERVVELERTEDTGPAMSTSAFAEHFAAVLSRVAEPAVQSDSAFTASVTGFSVTAKGLLRTTASGDVELVTPGPGKVASEALSTLNFDVKLLPRLPGGAPPPS